MLTIGLVRHSSHAGPRSHRTLLAVLLCLTTACSGFVEVRGTGTLVLDPPSEGGRVLAADGSVLAELATQDRESVALARAPQVLRDAVVAIEDARFYQHAGVDLRAIGRAVLVDLRDGAFTQGGSTITQQLAKNAVTGDAPTLERKLEEASVALQLERTYSKDEILERYLNTVYFGAGAYGVQAAARRYFGIDVADVTLAQAALLAGLLRAPATYDPYDHPAAALARRDTVLDRMAELGWITAAARAEAGAAPLEVVPVPAPDRWRHPYAVDHVMDVLQHDPAFHVLGADPVERARRLFGGGLVVETTIDPRWQAAAEEAVAATLPAAEDPRAAVVALDPQTGAVRALVGGRDFYDPGDPAARFNLGVDGRRQPGSAFKPLVLAAALGAGHALDEVFPGGSEVALPLPGAHEPWVVGNYGGVDLGPLTLRDATRLSVNVVYARLITAIGAQAVVDVARAAGVTSPLDAVPALALGSEEVSPLELASVQATLATGGLFREPFAVSRILDRDGAVLWAQPPQPGVRAIPEDVAWQVTLALQEVIAAGTGVRAGLARPTAGKTGTSQDSADAWFTGYTPDLAAAVWVGFPEGRVPMVPPRTRITVEGGTWPAEIFARFGLTALAETPARDFPIPSDRVVHVAVDAVQGCLPHPATPPALIVERAFLAGTEPTTVCAEPAEAPVVDVPDVVGRDVEEARPRLLAAGLRVIERARYSLAYPPGYVVAQDPPAGTDQTPPTGYLVTLDVATADRAPTAVPDVLNLAVHEARAALEDAGYVVVVDLACPGGGPDCRGAQDRPGTVWQQLPDAGAPVPAHSVVTLSAYPSQA